MIDLIKRNLGVFPERNLIRNSSNIPIHVAHEIKSYSLNYGHNPITNPTPFNVQNPYLKKNYEKILNILY